MPAAIWAIVFEQGVTWRAVLHVKDAAGPLDLTGYTARLQIRESLNSPAPLLSLTSAPGGGITIDGPAGKLAITVTDETTAAFTWCYGIYDLEIESPSGDVTRLLKGEVSVDREVTR
ncbi:hypothetical protein ACFY05_32840 [Microtetraspora fusca]|uniref:Uncharacterized protein n=1 Tax=Microtetraspora fusca TaxID=1997 RepID=A0ABW6VEF9_MICFU